MKQRILVGLGEVLWDVYPDAARFGGAPANVACHAASLGAQASMVSAVGTDDLGERARQFLEARGVNCSGVARDPAHATGRVLVTLNASGQPSYEIAADTAWDHVPWTAELAGLAGRCDAVCFGTLGQRGPVSRATIRRFVAATPASALRVFDVNLRQQFYDAEILRSSLELATAVKLNDEELPVVARLCGLGAGGPGEQLRELAARFDLRLAALTCGARGSLLLAEGQLCECPAPATAVVDTVGAGDAFTAALTLGYLNGWSLGRLGEVANRIAAYVCSQPGATPELPETLRAEFRQG